MELFFSVDGIIALLTLTVLEIVLGIDNVIFISILSDKLPEQQQQKARNIGLLLALIARLGLLMGISWIVSLTQPVFSGTWPLIQKAFAFSGRDLILLGGGLFLLAKSTTEIHHKLENNSEKPNEKSKSLSFQSVIIQIILLDVVFSFDSILTAIGLSNQLPIMIAAIIISMIVMLAFAGKISAFINKRPTIKMLALSFLLMIGMLLTAESFHVEVPKGYIYFAMAFSLFVEMLNIKAGKR